jgi:hypothetical protein
MSILAAHETAAMQFTLQHGVQLWETREDTRRTNLEAILDCVKLPNRLQSGPVPPLWIPQYGTIERKTRHFSMEYPKSQM